MTPNRTSPLPALLGRRVLVTGAAGFIGSHLVARAASHGARVTALVRAGHSPSATAALAGVTSAAADVLDLDGITRSFAEHAPEMVFHLAAVADWRQDPTLSPRMMQLHAVGAANVLEASRLVGAQRVVVFGSAGEYGAQSGPLREDGPALPLDPYSASKLAATQLALTYARSFGLACTIVRPFVVYGPGERPQRLLPSIFTAARRGGGAIDFTSGHQVRDFVHVDDVVEGALRSSLETGSSGAIVNLGTGVGHSVRELVRVAVAVSGGVVSPCFGVLPSRPGEPPSLIADPARCRELLGWAPSISLIEGLASTWASVHAESANPTG